MPGRPKAKAKRVAAAENAKAAAPLEAPVVPITLETEILHRPELALFVAQLIMCNGNASQAAQAMGRKPRWGRELVALHPRLKEIAASAILNVANRAVTSWEAAVERARQKIISLIDSIDDRIAIDAAREVVERVEGKVKQKFEGSLGGDELAMESVIMRFVASVHIAKSISVAEALDYAHKHPDEVESWARRRNLMPTGRRIKPPED